MLLIDGRLERVDGAINLLAHRLAPIRAGNGAATVKSRDFR